MSAILESRPAAAASPFGTEPSGLTVRGLGKSYGREQGVLALDNFSLDFPAGQCTVLLGPSGCGKTTVLRSIAGLITPDAGRIGIDNSVVFDAAAGVDVPPEKRRLGMVFQSYALWPHLSVAENIAYPLLSAGVPRSEIAARTQAMLQWIGLSALGERYVHELSGGQQQRVSLGRAMVAKPRAILFDEPLSNLDARLRERMRLELLALRQQAPFTSIYVTHDQLEAMTLADRVVVMRAGKIEQVGTPEDVYKRPRTRFSADFVGIPNLLEGTVRDVAGAELVVETVVGAVAARGWCGDWTPGAKCTVAVRPALLALGGEGTGNARRGRVIRSVYQGTSTIDLVDVDGTQVAVESITEERRAPGAIVALQPVPGAVFAVLDD
jgi:iron(III) transport system ATP-binding protein